MNIYEPNTKYSEVITEGMINNWKGNVILDGGTGTGKTHFILNTLIPYCKKNGESVLYLVSRDALKAQIKSEIKTLGFESDVTVANYQELEYIVKKGIEKWDVDFIVCDEWHYVLETYNKFTDVSYDWIIKHKAIKIFMSATCKNLFNSYVSGGNQLGIIVPDTNYYKIPKSYSYANTVFFQKKNHAEQIIKDKLENTNDKILYFANSLQHAIKIYKEFSESSSFYCSKHTNNNEAMELRNKHIDDLVNKTFKGRLLITTSALDVGFNLEDISIKHIIADIFDVNSLTQCLGRKRIVNENDTCTFYIRDYHAGMMNGKNNKSKELETLMLFKNNRDKYDYEYKMKRTFESEYIYFDKEIKDLKLNLMGFISILSYQIQRDKYLKSSYRDVIIEELGLTDVSEYEEEIRYNEISKLEIYLDSIVGNVMLKVQDRTELIEMINVRNGNNNRLIVGIDTLNAYLSEINLPYIIKKFETSRVTDGKTKKYKNAWKVLRLCECK